MRKSRKGIKLGRRVVNKTREIRKEASRMIEAGESLVNSVIIDRLNERGLNVSSGQVSVALRGLKSPDPLVAIRSCSMPDLLKAEEYAKQMGSVKKAFEALVAYSQIGSVIPETTAKRR